jgi:hypothetical protein
MKFRASHCRSNLAVICILLFFVSCRLWTSTESNLENGIVEIGSNEILTTPLVVDLCIDFDRIIQSESNGFFSTPTEALENAEFLALLDSGNHVLIAPIYEVSQEDITRWYQRKRRYQFKAKIFAFSGTYCNQYSMMEALDKCKNLSMSAFYHDRLNNGNGGSWLVNERDETRLIPGEVFIIKNGVKQVMSETFLTSDADGNEDSVLLEDDMAKISIDSIVKNMFLNELTSQDALLHNDDYLMRWMKESSAFKNKLTNSELIIQLEEELLEKKYIPSRDSVVSIRLIDIDFSLLELEWKNREVIQFYSNFNLLRSKKLFDDAFLSASNDEIEVLSKYKEMGDYWFQKSVDDFFILQSSKPLYKEAMPFRRKINCEFYASEFYNRGWQVMANERNDLSFSSKRVSTDTDPWSSANSNLKNLQNVTINDISEMLDSLSTSSVTESKGSAINNQPNEVNHQKHFSTFQSKFAVGSYGYYWELSQNLPDTLIEPIFATFSHPDIPSDAKIPGPVKYPRGIVFVVQVGAFRRDLPLSFYHQFAPVLSEEKGQGIHRYTAGLFVTFQQAKESEQIIKKLGFSDAFVAALKDGKRIPLNEAIRFTGN